MDFGLSEEQEMIVRTVRGFVERELYPLEAEVERTGVVPREVGKAIQSKVHKLGFYAPNIPTEYGGGGLDRVTFTLLERELGRASMALGLYWGRPSEILIACTDEQKERYLYPSVRGEKIDALAMSEPDSGSDVRSMTCTARRAGDDWILNGTKHFISHADVADFLIVFAATGEEPSAHGPKKRITGFLLDRDTPGMEVRAGYRSVSHRGYNNSILVFENCRVPSGQVLGAEGGGFDEMNTWLRGTRLTVAATCVGRARRAIELAVRHAAERRQFGQQIGKFQGVSFQLADMQVEVDAADYLMLAAAWALETEQKDANRLISEAKLFASEMLARVTDKAIQVFGGMGLMDELPLERLWRDARVERIWDGTSEIQRLIISRDLLRPLGA